MPSTPVCRPRIQASASAVRNIGTDRMRWKRLHPRAGLGQAAAQRRNEAEQEEGQSEAEAEAGEHRQRARGGQDQGRARAPRP